MYTQYWGKAGIDHTWRPVAGHVAAATRVAGLLLPIFQVFVQRLQERAGWTKEEAHNALLYAVAMHDIGKFHGSFQWKSEEGYLRTYGNMANLKTFRELNFDPGYYHGTMGLLWFAHIRGFKLMDNVVLSAASAHHGQFPDFYADLKKLKTLNGSLDEKTEAESLQDKKAMETFALEVEALFPPPQGIRGTEDISKKLRDFRKNNIITMIACFVSISDWIGSNDNYFPLKKSWVGEDITFTGFYNSPDLISQARQAVDNTGLSFLGTPQKTDIKALQDKAKTGLQEYVATLGDNRLTVIEFPTGDGKTEAAFLIAMNALKEGYIDRVVFALPTKATANAIYSRLNQQIHHSYGENRGAHLAHGDASRWIEFLKETTPPTEYFEGSVEEEPEIDSVHVRHRWLSSGKKGLLNNFVACTIDQVLMSALKNNKHFFVRLGAMASSLIILDEVHATDLYMGGILERALEIWASQGARVVLLSATLPQGHRKLLVDAFARGLGVQDPVIEKEGYPLITTLDEKGFVKQEVCTSRRKPRHIQVKIIKHDWEGEYAPHPAQEDLKKLALDLVGSVNNGACACCIMNTVGLSQKLYAEVEALKPDFDVYLLHAGLAQTHRRIVEGQLSFRFGPPWLEGVTRKPSMVIGTQILEQSLDLDFDRMVRQLCPVDGIIQAMGRCHRHQRENRPVGYESPTLEVFMPREDIPFKRNSIYTLVYGETALPLLRTWYDLRTRTEFEEPAGVAPLLQNIFGEVSDPTTLSGDLRWAYEKDGGVRESRLVAVKTAYLVMDEPSIKDTNADKKKFPTRIGMSNRPFIFMIPEGGPRYRVANSELVLDLTPFLALKSKIPIYGGDDIEFKRQQKRARKEIGDALKPLWKEWDVLTEAVQTYCASRSTVSIYHRVTVKRPLDSNLKFLEDLWTFSGMYPRGLIAVPINENKDPVCITRLDKGADKDRSKDYMVWYDPKTGLCFEPC